MKTLTIAIPTYNRAEKLDRQIKFLFDSLSNIDLPIKIIICDNCSEDATENLCKSWNTKFLNQGISFKYFKNATNLGLVGNMIRCIENSETDLVWVIGDDDNIIKDNLFKLLEIIKNTVEDYSIFHLNYIVMDGRNNEKIKDLFYEGDFNENISCINCLDSNTKVDAFMFITANIISKKIALEAINSWKNGAPLLAYPLYIYLYSSIIGSFKFIDFPVFIGYYHVGSWKKYASLVMRIEIPIVLLKLFNKNKISKSMFMRLIKNYTSPIKIAKEFLKKPILVLKVLKSIY